MYCGVTCISARARVYAMVMALLIDGQIWHNPVCIYTIWQYVQSALKNVSSNVMSNPSPGVCVCVCVFFFVSLARVETVGNML